MDHNQTPIDDEKLFCKHKIFFFKILFFHYPMVQTNKYLTWTSESGHINLVIPFLYFSSKK